MTATQTCGRRMQDLGPWERAEHLDRWRTDKRDSGTRTCSFCGSMHPDDLFAAIENGVELGPTDKSYKVYVHAPDPRAGEPRILSAITFEPTAEEITERGWVKVTRKHRKQLRADGWGGDSYLYLMFAARAERMHLKFYFQHLDDEGRKRFIELHNAGKIRFGYPGFLYSRPYFARDVSPPEPIDTP